VITADHAGVGDFSDPNEENNWIAKAWGSQMELRHPEAYDPTGMEVSYNFGR
jgi:hypothetical protein